MMVPQPEPRPYLEIQFSPEITASTFIKVKTSVPEMEDIPGGWYLLPFKLECIWLTYDKERPQVPRMEIQGGTSIGVFPSEVMYFMVDL
jgi:hypothetical protein